jgi:hypothetical protein
MSQAAQLTSDDLTWLANEYKKQSEYLSGQLPIVIAKYQDLVNRNAPLPEILVARQAIEDVSSSINKCNTSAIRIALKAITDTLIGTDVTNAKKALECSAAKLKIAQDKLEDVRNTLIIISRFIELATVLIAAAPAAGAGLPLAAIASVIDGIDKVLSTEIKKSLTPAELNAVSDILAKKCSKAST